MSKMVMRADVRTMTVEKRRSARDLVDYISQASDDVATHAIRVVNISPFGLMGRTELAPRPGTRIAITLPRFGAVTGDVRWSEDGRVGVEFTDAFSADDYAALLEQLPARART